MKLKNIKGVTFQKLRKNKRGSIFDFIETWVGLFVVLISVIVSLILISKVLPTEIFTGTADGITIANNARSALPSFDYIIPLGFIGVFIGSILLAFSISYNFV